MATSCPKCGATSTTSDYCDQCGALLDQSTLPPPVVAAALPVTEDQTCPSCGHPVDPSATFCESCGCDLATGALPEPAASPAAAEPAPSSGVPRAWELEVSVDPGGWAEHADLHGPEAPPASVVIPLVTSLVAIGRASRSHGTTPDIDAVALTGDHAISHRHCALSRDSNGRWSVRDEGSQNGTHLAGRAVSSPTAIDDGSVVAIGAWTRLILRARA